MNFNNKGAFEYIYKELHDKLYDKYLFDTGRKSYMTAKPLYDTKLNSNYSSGVSDTSIDDILKGDSEALFDKIKNTSSAIVSRLDIHSYINDRLNYNELKIDNEILESKRLYDTGYMLSERRRSMLTSEFIKLDKQRLDERVRCWKDVLNPMSYLVDIVAKYKQLEQDRKLLE